MNRRIVIFLVGIIASFCLVVGLRLLSPSTAIAQGNTNLLISAAASLKDSLEEIKPLYQQKHTNVTINYNFGASGALQQQIEQGAPADVFISAAQKQMKALESKNLILPDSQRNLLTNQLVLVVPSNSKLDITDFQKLTNSDVKRIAVGEFRSVPAGQYTEQVFTKLGILDRVKPKLVFGNNVRSVLAAVESGNADAGVVYITDAKTSKQVKIVATAAENLHSPIVYPIAVLKSSKNILLAKEYVQFLSDKEAKTIFKKYGFGIAK